MIWKLCFSSKQMQKTPFYKPLLNAIILLIAAQIGIYIYSSSLPYIQADLNTSQQLISSTLTAFIFTYGIAQLFIGPLSDYKNHSTLILQILTVLIISTLWMSMINNIYMLIGLRAVQGFAAGSISVLARSLLKNSYSAEELIKYIALYAMASTIIPAASPFVGGMLQDYFNWRSIFISMAIYLLMVLAYFYINSAKNCVPTKVVSFKEYSKIASKNYLFLLQSLPLSLLAICNAIIFYIEIIELTFSSFLLSLNYHISAANYGAIIAIPAIGFIIGSIIILKNTKISDKKLIVFGISTVCASGVILLFGNFYYSHSMWIYIAALTITNIGLAIAVSPIVTKAFNLFPKMSGSVIAWTGFTQMAGASFLAYITDKLFEISQFNLSIIILFMSLILLGLIKITFLPSYQPILRNHNENMSNL